MAFKFHNFTLLIISVMDLDILNKRLEERKYEEFCSLLEKNVSNLSDSEKQELLVIIMDSHYKTSMFSFFKKCFDVIIGTKLNLNFNIDHWAPTFLSLVLMKAPSKGLFNYFIDKGADLNFIGDSLAFVDEKSKKSEMESLLDGQYMTCLDFAEVRNEDLLSSDYHFGLPEGNLFEMEEDWRLTDENEEIIITKREYLYLREQAEYLKILVKTDDLIYHLKSKGGKTYKELHERKLERQTQ